MPGAATLRDCKTLESMVKKQAADGRPYAAICAAPAVALASWGLLKGLKVSKYSYTIFLFPSTCLNEAFIVDDRRSSLSD